MVELGIQDSVFLVQTYDEMGNEQNAGVMVAQTTTMQPELIAGTAPISGTMLLNKKATPDGNWIDALYVSRELNLQVGKLFSWDGEKTRELYTGDYETHSYAFLYQENLLLTLDETRNGFRPVSIQDYDTGTEGSIPGIQIGRASCRERV